MKELLKKYENKEPEIIFNWKDSETEAEGWTVINSLRGGAAGGGTRMRKGLDMKLKKFVNDMDTEPREKVITTMAKTLGKKPVEKMFSVRLREINETISDQKMEMLRKAYSSMPERLSIDQINKLKSVLSKFSKSELEQIKKAKINWLSSMAITLKASTQY